MDVNGDPALRVLSAPNLWNNSAIENLPNTDELGQVVITLPYAMTNTDRYGFVIK